MFLSLLAAVFAACSKDEVSYTPVEPLQITQADVEYEAAGGQGTITAEAAVTEAKCAASWVTVSTSGNKVNITVAENTLMDGRSAKISIKAGSKESGVTVTQKGIAYGLVGNSAYKFDDKAHSVTLPVVHSAPITVESSSSWITAVMDEESSSIQIKVAANAGSWNRSGEVTIKSASYTDVVKIEQMCDISKVVFGDYYLMFLDKTPTGDSKVLSATLTNDALLVQVNASTVLTFPASVDLDKMTVTVGPSGSFLGTYASKYFCYLMFGSAEGYWTAYQTTFTSAGDINMFEEEGSGVVAIEFGGAFANYSIDYWNIQALGAQEFNADNSLGYLYRWFYPTLVKEVEIEQ